MNIVVLDGYTLNPGDLSWGALRALGNCQIHDRTPAHLVVERARDAEVVLTNKTPIRAEHLGLLPDLRYIGVLATGTNVVDLDAAGARRIVVTNVPGYSTASVAQTTMALLLELALHVGYQAERVRNGSWSRSPDFATWEKPLTELQGLTMGIVGFGQIGRAVARLADAFGMQVLACTRDISKPAGPARFVDLPSLFRLSDVVSLHCPLTPETHRLVNAEKLAWMKSSAFLLNTARGPLIDEPALAETLNSGRIAGAALDVLSIEPPPPDNPLLSARNCVVTAHQAWATSAARRRLMDAVVENVRAFLNGTPQNVVTG